MEANNMITDEMKEILKNHHAEELRDCEEYSKLSEELKELKCFRASGILEDISREEKSHAKLIQHILETS